MPRALLPRREQHRLGEGLDARGDGSLDRALMGALDCRLDIELVLWLLLRLPLLVPMHFLRK